MKNGYLQAYSALAESARTEVAIIGGGISGALLAWHLAGRGIDVMLLDRRHIGMASTSASTALLQYDIDRTLSELIELIGERAAVRAYQMSLAALDDLERNAKQLSLDAEIKKVPSVRFAALKKDVGDLEKEYTVRKKYGFDVEFWDNTDVAKRFLHQAPAALYTQPSLTADPYRLTHGFMADAVKRGARVYDKTEVKRVEHLSRSVKLHTPAGIVTAKKAVIACGYESVNFIPFKLVSLSSSFAIVGEPIAAQGDIWYEDCTFWNTADPYIYGRTTSDRRVVFGGGDEPFFNPRRRDALLQKKTAMLERKFTQMFPDVPFRTDYSWAGTFIETPDGLPFIGTIKQLPHTYFALGYGGNGITFSELAARLLADLLTGKTNKDADIFSFDRKTGRKGR